MLIDHFDGKRLNSPNDVVVKSDGSIWFTDPMFGLLGNYEGYKAEPEIDTNVYRIDGATGKATIVAEGVLGPNGLCFSPDEKILYVVEIRGVPNRKILAYDVTRRRRQDFQQARARRRRPRHARRHALPTSTAICGAAGAWAIPSSTASWSSRPTACMIGRIALPERCANLCFGGLKRNRLFMAASQSIYALYRERARRALGG